MDFENKPIDWLDGDRYFEGRNSIPPDVYLQYAGKHVALTPDGTRVITSGDSHEEVDRNLDAMGIYVGAVVHDYFDAPDEPPFALI
jgi:hypothetical protein